MRQSIRGYVEGTIELLSGAGGGPARLATTAAELTAVRDLITSSDDLGRVLVDTGVPAASRRAVLTDLLESRVGSLTLELLNFVVDADRAPELVANLSWLLSRFEAAARDAQLIGEPVLGHKAAEERLEGYATAVLGPVERENDLISIEDELFRFMRIIDGNEHLRTALSSRAVPTSARKSLVEDLLRGKAHDTTVLLAGYATRVGRPRDYEALLAFLVDRVASESNRRLAEVRSAVDLDDDQRGHLAVALSRVVGHGVGVRVTVDPSVLGGFVATIGDTVVDGSARHRLEILKERLITPEATITTGERS